MLAAGFLHQNRCHSLNYLLTTQMSTLIFAAEVGNKSCKLSDQPPKYGLAYSLLTFNLITGFKRNVVGDGHKEDLFI